MRVRTYLLTAALAAGALMAQDGSFVAGMKTINAACGALTKMEKLSGPAAVAPAEKIAAVYEDMIQYWRQRNASDAVAASVAGKAAAVALASAANAGDADQAKARLGALTATCKSCHEKHREKLEDGRYRIK